MARRWPQTLGASMNTTAKRGEKGPGSDYADYADYDLLLARSHYMAIPKVTMHNSLWVRSSVFLMLGIPCSAHL